MIAISRIHIIAARRSYSSSPSSSRSSISKTTGTPLSASVKCCLSLWTTTSGRHSPCRNTGITSHKAPITEPLKIRVLMRSLKMVRTCQIPTIGVISIYQMRLRPMKFTRCSLITTSRTRTVSSASITPSTSCAGRSTHPASTLIGSSVSAAKASSQDSSRRFLSP